MLNNEPVDPRTIARAPSDTAAADEHALRKEREDSAQPQGNWFHRNRWFTKEPISYTAYQFVRSSIATIPYGFSMAFFHHVFGHLQALGARMGLTAEGVAKLEKEGIAAVDMESSFHLGGRKAMLGRNIMRFGSSPLNQAMQIGLGFTLFRFTGGLVKAVRDKIMDEKNTAEDTQNATKGWWQTVKDNAKVHWKAEAIGTFWAALTLGFIGANFKQSMPYAKQGAETFVQAVKRVWSKPSKLLQNAAIWTIAYSAFFEVDERIHKDTQIREGTWKGDPNSLINKKTTAIQGPAGVANDTKDDDKKREKPKGHFFTDDPGLPRLWLRRVLSVCVGISAYAALKRVGYIAAGGQMKPITQEVATGGVTKNIGHYLKNSYREGLATTMFGALWWATDAWGSWYDKFFENMQPPKPKKPQNERYDQKREESPTTPTLKISHAMAEGRTADSSAISHSLGI